MNNEFNADQEISQINMTPFVDIVLVLLIVFMATASFITQQALELNLPKAQTAATLSETDPHVTISIDPHGQLYVDDEAVTRSELVRHLDQANSEWPVLVRSDAGARYGLVVEVIDLCKRHGFFTFALESQDDDESRH
nr:biopolymer transporter ExbD [uncultured Desulfuromonas sp.]